MSGGGGGGSFQPADDGVACGRLTFEAALASPQPTAVAGLNVGEILAVQLQQPPGSGPFIAAVDDSGQIVGSLIDRVAELLRCIQSGYTYTAEVLRISGGSVRVRVSPSP